MPRRLTITEEQKKAPATTLSRPKGYQVTAPLICRPIHIFLPKILPTLVWVECRPWTFPIKIYNIPYRYHYIADRFDSIIKRTTYPIFPLPLSRIFYFRGPRTSPQKQHRLEECRKKSPRWGRQPRTRTGQARWRRPWPTTTTASTWWRSRRTAPCSSPVLKTRRRACGAPGRTTRSALESSSELIARIWCEEIWEFYQEPQWVGQSGSLK